ncbi:MAG TPA: hypothetical protein VLX32_00540 [Candidatus Acidoferrum sp.]|nr:hypothetical protein [Candidatus Acidoferrum sp.]
MDVTALSQATGADLLNRLAGNPSPHSTTPVSASADVLQKALQLARTSEESVLAGEGPIPETGSNLNVYA